MKDKQLKIGAIISYITIGFNILTGILYTPWLLKMLGESDYSIYTLAMSVISLFMVDFGIGSSISKYVSAYAVKNDTNSINDFMGLVYKLYLIIDAVILIGLSLFYFILSDVYKALSAQELNRFKVVYLIVGAYSLIQLPFLNLNGILWAYEKFILSKLLDLLQKVAIVCTMILLLLSGKGLFALVLVNAFYSLLIVAIKYFYIKKRLKIESNFRYWDRRLIKGIFSMSVAMTVILLMQRMFYNTAPSILAALGEPTFIILFSFASSLEGYVYTIGNAINGMFLPKLTRYEYEENSADNIMKLSITVGKYIMLLMGFIVTGWVTVGERFIADIWLGDDYKAVYVLALILMIPDWLMLPQQVPSTVLIVRNKIKYQARVYVIGGLMSLLLSVIFTKLAGVYGICLAICIANIAVFFMMNRVYYKQLNINILLFARKIYLRILPCQIAVMVLGRLIDVFNPLKGLLGFIIEGILICGIYICIMFLCVLTKEERTKIFVRIGRK